MAKKKKRREKARAPQTQAQTQTLEELLRARPTSLTSPSTSPYRVNSDCR